jgi:hypothetical protein
MLAHLLVSKYCDHLPLYRQSEIYARDGLYLDRSTLSDWVGQAVWLLQPIVDGIRNHVFAAEKIHADDTPVPVLEPGLGRTRTGRLWVYVRDDRPFCGPAPPAAVYFTAPIAVARTQPIIWRSSPGFCRPMPIAGSPHCTSRAKPVRGSRQCRRLPRSPAGPTAAEPSSMYGNRPSRPSPKWRSIGSPSSISSRTKPVSPRPPSGWRIAPL